MTAPFTVFGATVTGEVSLLNPRQNVRGTNFYWDNLEETLTISDLRLSTNDDYGFKLPDNATVILKGTSYIKAKEAPLYLNGNITIKGSGKLVLEGGEYGILCNSIKEETKLNIVSGKIEIKSSSFGINSDFSEVLLSGGSLKITSQSQNGIYANGLTVASKARVESNGTLSSAKRLSILGANVTVSAGSSPALSAKEIKLENMSLMAGNGDTAAVDKYSGESNIVFKSTLDKTTKSIIFGENYPIILDIILLIATVAVLGTAVVLPPYIKRKRALAIIAQTELDEAERKRQIKEEKKSASKKRRS